MHAVSRRNLLGQAVVLGAAGRVPPSPAATESGTLQGGAGSPARKLKVVVCGGHPGDPEYGCGGTVARYSDLGHEVVLLYLNRGEWPPNPAPEAGKSRMAEAKAACEILRARPLDAGQLNGEGGRRRRPLRAIPARSLRPRAPTSSSPSGPSTTMPTTGRSRCWPTTPGSSWARSSPSTITRSRTARTRSSSRRRTTSISPRPNRGNAGPATPTPARLRTSIYALQEMVTRMRGVESGHRQAEGFIRHVQSPDFGLPMA